MSGKRRNHRKTITIGLGALGISACVLVSPAKAIIGGHLADPLTEPTASVVSVHGEAGEFCTGSLVAPQWVVTARHCLHFATTVRAATPLLHLGGQVAHVDRKVPGAVDFGLLHLTQAVNAPLAQIATQSPPAGAQVLIMGWGRTSNAPNGATFSERLKALHVPVLNTATACNFIDATYELCVGSTTTDTSCYGDSGGPLIWNGLLVGEDSGGALVCGTGPNVYENLTAFRTFITQQIANG